MTRAPKTDAYDDRPAGDRPKSRPCLRCRTEFPSEWSGERICPRCKKTESWKNGVPGKGPSIQR